MKNNEIAAEPPIHPDALQQMRERGGTWAAYQNAALDSSNRGHLKFLRYGKDCTFEAPPKPQLPDTAAEINWPYQFVGLVNLDTGELERSG